MSTSVSVGSCVVEAKRAKHDAGEDDLRHGIELGHQQRLDLERVTHQPGQHDPSDDQDIARHHQDHQPARDIPVDPKGQIDRDDQRLVGERVEIGTEFGGHVRSAWPGSRRRRR